MKQIVNIEKTTCYHCGDDCLTADYFVEDKQFCCLGCKSVFEVLYESKLCNYYTYNAHPGASRAQTDKRFDYLNEPDIINELIDYKDDNIIIVTLYIPQIHCSSCLWLLEQLNKMNPAIHYSRVDFLKKHLNVRFDHHKLTLQKLVELLYNIGYEPVISLQDIIKKQNSPAKDNLVQKIAVAGFCFGNVMLLSFPEYFGISVYEQSFRHFFGWLNILFALPVVFYSGWGYFTSAWQNLRIKILNIDFPLALGIAVLFIRSVVDIIINNNPGFTDTLCGLIFFLLIGKFIQKKTYYHISFERDYRSFFPVAVSIINNDVEKPVPLAQLQTGQRMIIRHNEIIPADAILLKGNAQVDFSFVTGESIPVNKTLGEIIYAGGRQTGEAIELEVMRSVSQSYLTQLWNNNEEAKMQVKSKTSFVEKVNKYFTLVVIGIAIISVMYWWWYDSSKVLNAFTAVLIVACPCGLLLTTAFASGNILRIFGRNKFYLKNSSVIEKLAAADVIVFDKTGTITNGSDVQFNGNEPSNDEKLMIYAIASQSSHPLAAKLKQYYPGIKGAYKISHFKEFPGQGVSGIVNGREISMGSDYFITGHTLHNKTATCIYVEIDAKVKGYFSFTAHYRPGLPVLVKELSGAHQLMVLSGDNAAEKNRLQQVFGPRAVLLFGQKPEDKKNHIRQMQDQGHKVIMLGDGLNDAGALLQSDVGIAVSDNTNTFSPACDIILDGSSLHLLSRFIRLANTTRKIITTTFLLSVIYNITGLFFAIQGTLSPVIAAILMPASTVSIVLLTTLGTRYAARRQQL